MAVTYTPLLPVSVPPVEGANGRHSHTGLRSAEGPPSELIAYSIALSRSGDGNQLIQPKRAGFAPADAADARVALFRACPIALAAPWLILTRGNRTTRHVDCRLGALGRDDHDRGPHARSLSDL